MVPQAELPPSTLPVLGMFENLPVEPDCEVYTADIPTTVRRSIEDKANITHQNHNDSDGDQNTGHRDHYMLFLYRRVSGTQNALSLGLNRLVGRHGPPCDTWAPLPHNDDFNCFWHSVKKWRRPTGFFAATTSLPTTTITHPITPHR